MNFKFLKNLKNYWQDKQLNWLSFIFIIFLDIFVLINLFQWLDFQKKIVTNPDEIHPYSCINLLEQYNDNEIIFNNIINTYNNKMYYWNNDYYINKETISEQCDTIFNKEKEIQENNDIKNLMWKIKSLDKWIEEKTTKIYNLKEEYNTTLIEKWVNQNEELSITEATAETTKSIMNNLESEKKTLEEERLLLKNELLKNTKIIELQNYIENNKDFIKKDLANKEVLYKVKKTFFEFIFLLPVIFTFFYLYSRYSKKWISIYTLIFSHMIVVSLITLFIKIVVFIIDILPFHLLEFLIDFLEDIKLIALWNYFLIILWIFITIWLVYLSQKKIFSKERHIKKKVKNNECIHCWYKVNYEKDNFCQWCWKQIKEKCKVEWCEWNYIIWTNHCSICGQKTQEII